MKLDRLLAITMLLLNRKRVGAKELSDRFEVSLRTIYRDLETINQAGIPIVSYAGATGGYEIMDQYRVERQYLSMEELQSIIIALKGIRSTMEEHDISALLDKVGALVARSEQELITEASQEMMIDMNPWRSGTEEKEKLSILRSSIRQSRMIRFNYTNSGGDGGQRSCEPMSVVLKGYVWYLYGYCLLRQDFRIFRLSRMEELETLTDTFQRRNKSLDELDLRWSRDFCPAGIRMVLQFQPRAKPKVQDYFESSQIEVRPDGTLLVTAVQPEEPWLYGLLLSYGSDLLILEPPHLARIVADKAQEIVNLYQPILT
jgi:predicted DNA-binding transcriptional regulator YafY